MNSVDTDNDGLKIFAVADGVSGKVAGDVASRIILDHLTKIVA